MPVDAVFRDLPLHRFDEMQLELDLLAARNGYRLAHEGHAISVLARVGCELRRQRRPRGQHALVHEDDATVTAVGLVAAERVDKHRIVGGEKSGGENDRELVGD
jgi:hypothetical protein